VLEVHHEDSVPRDGSTRVLFWMRDSLMKMCARGARDVEWADGLIDEASSSHAGNGKNRGKADQWDQ
jgi:hypothetical protein